MGGVHAMPAEIRCPGERPGQSAIPSSMIRASVDLEYTVCNLPALTTGDCPADTLEHDRPIPHRDRIERDRQRVQVHKVLDSGLKAILCIGESKEEYEAGLNKEVREERGFGSPCLAA